MNADEFETIDDELLVLARDARATRKRTNRWTTGLIVGGMAASTVYVGTVNQQIDSLQQSAEEASSLSIQLAQSQQMNKTFAAERDAYKSYANYMADVAAGRVQGASMSGPTIEFPDGTTPPQGISGLGLANVVWVAEGSRRFPMTFGDILWIPEGKFWIQLEERETTAEITPRKMDVWIGDQPSEDLDGSEQIAEDLEMRAEPGTWYQRNIVDRQTSNCVNIRLHDQSNRPGFGQGFTDIEVLYVSRDACSDGLWSTGNPPPELESENPD